MAAVLAGARVAAFTHFAAGPLAAQFLGELGASVVKVEAPWGDLNRYAVRDPEKLQGISPYFIATNRSQRAIVLDMRRPAGREVARRLALWADVLIENHRPGAMGRLGLGYEDVRGFNERIVYASCSAYGQEGPGRDLPGQDLLLQARTGIASLTGRGDGPPVPVGAYVIDAYASLMLVIGILGALRHRDATGHGQWVQIDMFSTTLHMLAQEAAYVMNVKPHPERSRAGIAHVDQAAPYGVYQANDGYLVMSLADPTTLEKVAAALGVDREVAPFASEVGLRQHRDEIAEALGRPIKSLSIAEVTQRLAHTGVWVAPVRDLPEALRDPVVAWNALIKQLSSPYGGEYRVIGNPLRMSETPPEGLGPAPAPGQDTVAVLRELKYTDGEIAALLEDGIAVRWPAPAAPDGNAVGRR